MLLKSAFVLFCCFPAFFWSENVAGASWLIHAGRFHVSAHGQTSCRECHGGAGKGNIHPNPAEVGKKRSDSFTIEQCLACHDDTLDKLEAGTHGARKVSDGVKYRNCIRCHRPHEEIRREDLRSGRYDPSRPPEAQCGACHKPQSELPKRSGQEENCMACHQAEDPRGQEGKERLDRLCFHCHGRRGTQAQKMTGEKVRLIDVIAYQSVPHEKIACTLCHPEAAGFNHANQRSADCRQCHGRHDEKVARDAHFLVSCETCHLGDVAPVRDTVSKRILWERVYHPDEPSRVHSMRRGDDEASCRRCHSAGNAVGAAAILLPPKGILCMPCHASTFSVGDATTVVSLLLFLGGVFLMLSYWFTGSVPGHEGAGPMGKAWHLLLGAIKGLFSKRIGGIAKILLLDVFLQRRLYRQSVGRWIIHGFIFWPFAFRFSWGLIALTGSLWAPEWGGAWILLDKNHPVTAFSFDVTGVLLFAGVLAASGRGLVTDRRRPSGLPRRDRLALGLIGSVVTVGFLLEGMRIAMTGFPQGAEYAFIGSWLARLFRDPTGLVQIYGYVWYAHAVLTGAFVAYIPFSRLAHVIVSPIVLVLRASESH